MEGALIVIGIFTYFALNTKIVLGLNDVQNKRIKKKKNIHSKKELSLKKDDKTCYLKKCIKNFEKFNNIGKHKIPSLKRKNKIISIK